MKQLTKKGLSILGVVLAVIIISATYIGYQFRTAMAATAPIATAQINQDIIVIKDDIVNMYLIKNGDKYIAIDAGTSKTTIAHELNKLGIAPDKVEAVFLTHSDYDHIAAIPLFSAATVYLPTQEVQMINGQTSRMFIMKNNRFPYKYQPVADGQIFTIGQILIQPILTPGHTPGSTCYIVNNKYLFTGDTLGLKDGKVTDFIKLFNMDTAVQRASIKKFSHLLGISYIFTAHHGYSDDYKKSFEYYN